MKKFAVGYLNCFDNDLVLELIEADDWKKAICGHSSLQGDDMDDWLKSLPDTIDEVKQFFFDGDSSIDVIEVT